MKIIIFILIVAITNNLVFSYSRTDFQLYQYRNELLDVLNEWKYGSFESTELNENKRSVKTKKHRGLF